MAKGFAESTAVGKTADFRLRVMLKNPVPKVDLIQAGLLKGAWPRNSAGKILKKQGDIEKLAEMLNLKNPGQRRKIYNALRL